MSQGGAASSTACCTPTTWYSTLYRTSDFHLQQALYELSGYVKRVGLTINAEKTEALRFRRGGSALSDREFALDGMKLNI